MKLLLDTHAFLWFVLDDPKLSQPARQAIESDSNEIFLSPASYCEIAIKISLGKYRLNGTFEEFWDTDMLRNEIAVLPIETSHAARMIAMLFHHKDPFDLLGGRTVLGRATASDQCRSAHRCVWRVAYLVFSD